MFEEELASALVDSAEELIAAGRKLARLGDEEGAKDCLAGARVALRTANQLTYFGENPRCERVETLLLENRPKKPSAC